MDKFTTKEWEEGRKSKHNFCGDANKMLIEKLRDLIVNNADWSYRMFIFNMGVC